MLDIFESVFFDYTRPINLSSFSRQSANMRLLRSKYKKNEKETNLPQSTLSTFADTLLKGDFGANPEKRVTAQYFCRDK